jgi:hypothetical protein
MHLRWIIELSVNSEVRDEKKTQVHSYDLEIS